MKMKPLFAAEVRFLVNSPYILALQLMPQPHRIFLNIFNLLTMTIFSCIFFNMSSDDRCCRNGRILDGIPKSTLLH